MRRAGIRPRRRRSATRCSTKSLPRCLPMRHGRRSTPKEERMAEYETIRVEQRGAVTLITLNRPRAPNALNSRLLGELIAALAAYEADASQGCAVLTGSEKAFAAGADIKEM